MCCALHDCIAPPHAALDAMRRSIPSATYHCRNNPSYVQRACRYSVSGLCAGAMLYVYSCDTSCRYKTLEAVHYWKCVCETQSVKENARQSCCSSKYHFSYNTPSRTTSSVLTCAKCAAAGTGQQTCKRIPSDWPTCALRYNNICFQA